MATYAPSLTVRAAREEYFRANGFGDGGYESRWVKLKAGPIPLAFPNTRGRVRAVKLHDIHHVLTGYDTTWRGEAEIGAWEIASGCGRHYAAWVLNLWAMAIGLVIAPGRILRAWRRGDSAQNLYREEFGPRLLDVEVGTLRARIRLDEGLARRGAVLRFTIWALIAVLALLAVIAIFVAPLALVARWLL